MFRAFAALRALHATRSSHEKAVCLSFCQTRDLWQNKRKSCPHSYTTCYLFWLVTGRMVGSGRPLLPEILGQTDPVGAKTPIFNIFSLVAPQPSHLAKTV